MKKIYYSFTVGLALVGLVLAGLLSGCEDVNEQFNQQELDSLSQIRNVATYNYTLTSTDYGTICTKMQEPITALVKLNQDTIDVCKDSLTNHLFIDVPDSLRMVARIAVFNGKISALKLDPTYVQGNLIKNEKFISHAVLIDPIYVAALMNTKYPYAENYGKDKSAIYLTYNMEFDTTVTGLQKATMTMANYDAMGNQSGQPGKNDYFSSSIDPLYYIPIFLKQSFPYAKVGDAWLIRYKYYVSSSSTVQRWLVSVYDGTKWGNSGYKTSAVAKFALKNGKWTFIDSDILIGLKTSHGSNLGDFTPISVNGAQVWAWNSSYNYTLMTGYVARAYYDNEDWLVSPAMNFTERTTPILTFDHVGRYFGDAAGVNTKMKIAISVWVSTTSDGTTIVPSEWTKLTLPEEFYPSGANWTFIPSGSISLAAYAGNANVRFAFKYLSSAADGAAGSWEIKNVYVFEE